MVDEEFRYDPMPYVGLVACREAVLKPILKGVKKKKLLKLPLERQHESLQRFWRLRATKLGHAGWVRGQAGTGLQYLRNCPPFGVSYGTSNRARKCNCRRICPSCYARETVEEAYKSVEWAFYMKSTKPVVVYDLVLIRKSWTFTSSLPKIFEAVKKQRHVYRDKFDQPVGSIIVSTIEPVEEGWKVQLSTIVAVAPSDKPDLGDADSKRLSPDGMTKRKLAMAVGWALRYPLGMMYGDVTRTAQLIVALSANKGAVRQYVSSGAMKNQNIRRMEFREHQ
jgi:hypothetical protein